jgi:hypothetical protein
MIFGLHVSPFPFLIVRRSSRMAMTSSGVYGGEICRYSEPKTGVSTRDWMERLGGSLIYPKLCVSTVLNFQGLDSLPHTIDVF